MDARNRVPSARRRRARRPGRYPFLAGFLFGVGVSTGGFGAVVPQPAAEAPSGAEVRVIFVGDTGTGDHRARRVVAQMRRTAAAEGISRVFLLGDNVYEEGRASDIEPKFLEIFRPLLEAGVRVHAALGNHDVQHCEDSRQRPVPRTASAYRAADDCWAEAHLETPEFGYHSGHRYYSIRLPAGDSPLLEVFVLDTNTLNHEESPLPDDADEPQVAWLTEALRSSPARWKIVAMHHPIHTPRRCRFLGLFCRGPSLRLRALLEPRFREHGVDLVFQGHMHLYARLRPQHGIQYFVNGAGGKPPDRFAPGRETHPRADRGQFNHFLVLRATQERVEYTVFDTAGRIRDSGVHGGAPAGKGDR